MIPTDEVAATIEPDLERPALAAINLLRSYGPDRSLSMRHLRPLLCQLLDADHETVSRAIRAAIDRGYLGVNDDFHLVLGREARS